MDTQAIATGLMPLSCIAIRQETPTIKTFRLRARSGPVSFVPGQALVLKVPMPDGPLWRSFTISGGGGGDLHLTIKAQAAGGATRWLHDHFREGDVIEARPPRGTFTLALRSNEKLAFVSGGSGATPMMAMLRDLAESEPEADLAWFHAARDPSEMLFTSELTELQRRMPRLSVAVTVTRPAPGWFGYHGRIRRGLLAAAVPDFGRREVFCCGPGGFMQEARLIHAAEGGAKAQFHTESFGTETPVTPVAPEPVETGGPAHLLKVNGRDLHIRPAETVLQASLRQGVVIPCGCGEGMCGTCMVRLVSGDVDARPNGGLTAEEAEQGYILACSSRAVSDVEIALE
ncbi:hybrid-cluster NAD(P)-dependent oxidoreductase [Paracoccus methylarcula]|uniref:Hybrid-cluster NAD(P)-dependent oxidoreductase n=1 Tax=Paracoccus methylarcula TaxID=72022 RepID=A0A422QZ34_9RHOB|nr:hybrid-cluster NAD(P)-dependent oxidoreductase [Paracoccus methylarcula]RNF35257.1 hybrid-cluster NAD(P)-dependent oxidoreductase [Paracoccus methylarcula]